MKKKFLIIVSLLALLVAACGQANSTEAIPTVVLDSGSQATSNGNQPSSNQSSGGDTVAASANVVPVQDAQLSFTSVGRVTQVNVQAGDKVNAGDVLIQLDTSILEAKVREAEANLAYAEIQLKYLLRTTGCKKNCGPFDEHIEVAQNDVASAQALVDSAKAVLAAQSNLVAPFSGTIVSVNISPYETVTPGLIVVTMGDLSKYRVETTDLSERDVNKVKIGQPATISIDALSNEFTGKVADIDRISSEVGGDVVYKVTIEFDQQPAGLLWGMSADVKIDVSK